MVSKIIILMLVSGLLGMLAFAQYPALATQNDLSSLQVSAVSPLKFSDSKYASAVPMALSPDGKTVLIQYGVYNETSSRTKHALALTDPDLSNVIELSFPQSFPAGQPTLDNVMVFMDDPVSVAYFSPAYGTDNNHDDSDWDIFFLWKREVYAYNIVDSRLEKLLDGATYFDVTSSPSQLIYNNDVGERNGRVSIFDIDTRQSEVLLDKVTGIYTFDFSPDDKKIVFKDDGPSRSGPRHLVYYDILTKERKTIPVIFGCYFIPHWTHTGSSFVIYNFGDCERSRGVYYTTTNVTSLEGQSEYLISPSYGGVSDFLISSDGKSMIVTLSGQTINGTLIEPGTGDMYRVDFARPVPEFPHQGVLIVFAIIGVFIAMSRTALLSRFYNITIRKS